MGVFELIILWGPANKSCSLGLVCLVKFYLWGALLNPGPIGSTPPNGGICIDNFVWASKQNLLLGVGLPGKILFVGAHSNLWPAGSNPTKGGICIENWEKASKQNLHLGLGLPGIIVSVGGSLQPGARRLYPKIDEVIDHFVEKVDHFAKLG